MSVVFVLRVYDLDVLNSAKLTKSLLQAPHCSQRRLIAAILEATTYEHACTHVHINEDQPAVGSSCTSWCSPGQAVPPGPLGCFGPVCCVDATGYCPPWPLVKLRPRLFPAVPP